MYDFTDFCNVQSYKMTMSSLHTITFKNLSKIYISKTTKTIALDKFDLSLQNGFYGLLGPNGAGKSTLINIITGNLSPSKGKIIWDGKTVSGTDISFRKILGYVPQQQRLYNSFTGKRFLLYMAELKSISHKYAFNEVNRVTQLVRLEDNIENFISSYSGGMKQRLLIAASLLGNPQLLIMDEPTAGLDPKERVLLRKTLSALSQSCIIIFATHVVSDVETDADGILLLKKGVLIDYDTPQSLIKKIPSAHSLEDVYLTLLGDD